MQPSENEMRMLKRISRERDLFTLLESMADGAAGDSLTQEGPQMYRTQGMALAFRKLAKLLAQAAQMP